MGSLHTIFQTFAIAKSHRLVCIDKNNRCDGIVTLSDLLNYFYKKIHSKENYSK